MTQYKKESPAAKLLKWILFLIILGAVGYGCYLFWGEVAPKFQEMSRSFKK